jgi:hypothetical protein
MIKIRCICICFFNIFFLGSITLAAQCLVVDSKISDTSGISRDIQIIESKLGTFPDSLFQSLRVLELTYFSLNEQDELDTNCLHKGVMVLHESVVSEVQLLFKKCLDIRFPIKKIVPVNLYGLNEDSTGWNDLVSMYDNNSSAFNFRRKTFSSEWSPHAFGTAIDINPLWNPYISYQDSAIVVLPQGSKRDLLKSGCISQFNIVDFFDEIGWVWGGRWSNPEDWQHFDKRPDRSLKHYLLKDAELKSELIEQSDGSIRVNLAERTNPGIQRNPIWFHTNLPFQMNRLNHCQEFKNKLKISKKPDTSKQFTTVVWKQLSTKCGVKQASFFLRGAFGTEDFKDPNLRNYVQKQFDNPMVWKEMDLGEKVLSYFQKENLLTTPDDFSQMRIIKANSAGLYFTYLKDQMILNENVSLYSAGQSIHNWIAKMNLEEQKLLLLDLYQSLTAKN